MHTQFLRHHRAVSLSQKPGLNPRGYKVFYSTSFCKTQKQTGVSIKQSSLNIGSKELIGVIGQSPLDASEFILTSPKQTVLLRSELYEKTSNTSAFILGDLVEGDAVREKGV